ncbi:MAG: glycoside hydrolase family 127 protein [Candidatus Cohnella colombiensis]|uniref:Glycoside hydrolase family 127 protein n=1 Tax=Candidatus Cohnella colombiensis TaxID=3121368 RepID=A0AA95EX83_9BACL|nr:MAG: glycoside hydrolase family 127 protein [Cohnella sp.]
MKPISLNKVEIKDKFWTRWQRLIKDDIVPYQWSILNDQIPGVEKSQTIENFRMAAGEVKGEFYGMVFQDSDLAKWLETASYVLTMERNEQLEQWADGVIDILERAQQADGYLNTYFTVAEPDLRWKNLKDGHELYCAGHMIEAAVAYYEATGKSKILHIASKMADQMDAVFGIEEGKLRGYDGHPEIELALIRLYRATNNRKYLNLSKYFVEERGRKPNYFDQEDIERQKIGAKNLTPPKELDYYVAHAPVTEMETAEGHAVRAVYLFSAMADLAAEYQDQALLQAVKKMWQNIVNKRMYITGGIGSSGLHERFTVDYDLPNDRVYAETCASVGFIMWAYRMLELEEDRRYADVMEQVLYNGALSGISLDGKKYFYVNPLEVKPSLLGHRNDLYFVKGERQSWYGCACCPPNIARLLASLGQYIYSYNEARKNLFVHLYIGSQIEQEIEGQLVQINQTGHYPWNGDIQFQVATESPVHFTLALRIPAWCDSFEITVNGERVETMDSLDKGYLKIARTWNSGDRVELLLPMKVRVMRSNPLVRDNVGKISLLRGPIVYCLEQIDNKENLPDIGVSAKTDFQTVFANDLLEEGAINLEFDAWVTDSLSLNVDELYFQTEVKRNPFQAKAIPYFLWANREPGEMLVWIKEEK